MENKIKEQVIKQMEMIERGVAEIVPREELIQKLEQISDRRQTLTY